MLVTAMPSATRTCRRRILIGALTAGLRPLRVAARGAALAPGQGAWGGALERPLVPPVAELEVRVDRHHARLAAKTLREVVDALVGDVRRIGGDQELSDGWRLRDLDEAALDHGGHRTGEDGED